MIIPSNAECIRVLKELADEPNLNDFEESFVQSNLCRATFSDKQKEVVASLKQKYEV